MSGTLHFPEQGMAHGCLGFLLTLFLSNDGSCMWFDEPAQMKRLWYPSAGTVVNVYFPLEAGDPQLQKVLFGSQQLGNPSMSHLILTRSDFSMVRALSNSLSKQVFRYTLRN